MTQSRIRLSEAPRFERSGFDAHFNAALEIFQIQNGYIITQSKWRKKMNGQIMQGEKYGKNECESNVIRRTIRRTAPKWLWPWKYS